MKASSRTKTELGFLSVLNVFATLLSQNGQYELCGTNESLKPLPHKSA